MRRGPHRPEPPEEVYFPVVPMLDMAFQLLSFFVLTFQTPSRETRLDLYLPAAPAALPAAERSAVGRAARPSDELENDLVIRAEADARGNLRALRLGEAPLADPAALGARLAQYGTLLDGRSVRVVLIADDTLKYDIAADLIGTCSAAGVESIRLADPNVPAARPAP